MDPQREQCDQCSPSTSSLFTADCTDQCLVLTCDVPDQSCLITNDAASCDGACVTAEACNDCTGLDEIVSISLLILAHVASPPPQFQCCTDYHSYCAPPNSYDSPPFVRWEHSFSDLPCECTQASQPTYPPASLPQSIHSLFSDSSISSSASSSPSLPPFSPQLHVTSPFALQPTSTQPFHCMWANCDSVFSSLSDLVDHVNLQHLCTVDTRIHSSTLSVQPQHDPCILSHLALSCHWGDCAMFPSPSSIPSSSSTTSDHDVLNILATHLMQDHLGLNCPSTTLQPPPADLHDASDTVGQPPTSPNSPSHDCSGPHVCKWKACTQLFPSCDDLTAHIGSIHIGSGKAHYECFWEGCNRHGTNGFSSKQKISRHLQVRLSSYSITFRSSHISVTHRPPPLSMSGMQPKFF